MQKKNGAGHSEKTQANRKKEIKGNQNIRTKYSIL